MSNLNVKMWERSPDYPVNLDIMPSTRLQAKLNPKQPIFYMIAEVGYGNKSTPSNFKKIPKSSYKRIGDLEGSAKRVSSNKLKIRFGSNDPLDKTFFTNEGIDADITAFHGTPTTNIKRFGTIDKITKPLEKQPLLTGVENIFCDHKSVANRPNYMKDRLNIRGLNIINTYQDLKENILSRHRLIPLVPTIKEDLKRVKSFLVNQTILTDTKVGYDSLYPIKQQIQTELRKKRFWKDTAIPNTLTGDLNGITGVGMTICKLDGRKGKLIVI